ncbi:RNAse P Rpr2/Rpp21/SNM1 subunit domain-containing protein [Syncephalis fuscata]|nr:RNAse P Rpr2/Rpp21/SNM1 subunit domain-containing protein [Syncephalis fuscata]
MGKAKKEKQARPLQNAEEFQRMNFLYQAASLMTAAVVPERRIADDTAPGHLPKRKTRKSKPRPSQATKQAIKDVNNPTRPALAGLGRFYVSSLKTIAKRNVLRLDPTLKRALCRRCDTLLLPGITFKLQFEENINPAIITRCQYCQAPRRLPIQPAKELFCEKPENAELIELS